MKFTSLTYFQHNLLGRVLFLGASEIKVEVSACLFWQPVQLAKRAETRLKNFFNSQNRFLVYFDSPDRRSKFYEKISLWL